MVSVRLESLEELWDEVYDCFQEPVSHDFMPTKIGSEIIFGQPGMMHHVPYHLGHKLCCQTYKPKEGVTIKGMNLRRALVMSREEGVRMGQVCYRYIQEGNKLTCVVLIGYRPLRRINKPLLVPKPVYVAPCPSIEASLELPRTDDLTKT